MLRPTLLCGLLALAGCAGIDGARIAKLPFRVAVLPVAVQYVDANAESGAAGVRPALAIEVDAAGLGGRIADGLGRRVFADAVLLPPPPPDPGGPADVRGHHVLRAAQAHGANLLLECELRVTRHVVTARNDRFWLNIVLFAIGGPFSWFVADRSYHFDAHLFARLHQLEPLADGTATFADGRACLADVHASVQEIALNLVDRAGGDLVPYLGSIVVPPGFLVPESAAARERLQESLTAQLTHEIARQLADVERQVADGGGVTGISLGTDVRAEPAGTGWRLHGTAFLRTTAASRLDSCVVRAGALEGSVSFDEAASPAAAAPGLEPALRAHPFTVKLPALAAPKHFDLEIRAGGRDRHRRSFCVPVTW